MDCGMETKLLIAIDRSDNALKAVDYVGSVLSCHPEVDISLLHVINEPSPDLMPDFQERRRAVAQTKEETLRLMESIGQRLTACGIPEKRIHLKIQTCQKVTSVAELILHELQAGGYDTVVIGRRGVSKREEFLFGSVSNRIVREAKNCAVWVVE
jgi:nucleotide-binding universal stress UspA family protein